MPTRQAAPRPSRKPIEKLNAPGGKSKALAGSKCTAPVRITATLVISVPIHSVTVSLPMAPIVRAKSAMLGAPEVPGALGEADGGRRDLQRPAEDELPDEQEGGQAPPALAPVALAQVHVGAAGAGQRRP